MNTDTQCPIQPSAPPSPDLPPRPRTPDELHRWLFDNLGVRVPRTPVTPGHAAPFDYLIFTFFEGADGVTPQHATPDCVLWANRAGGKTFLAAIATLLDMLYKDGIAIRILSGSLDQSQRMLAYLHCFLDDKRPALAAQLAGKPTANRIVFKNGSEVEVLAQSQTSVRGTHVQKLRCDEVELFDRAIWEAAQFTTQSKVCNGIHVRGSVECLSTMHVPGGLMHRLVCDAEEGARKLFRWGLMDVLEHCGPARQCQGWCPDPQITDATDAKPRISLPILYGNPTAPCPLFAECQGVAKLRPPEEAGHYRVEDAIATKGRVHKESWEAEMLCHHPSGTSLVIPEFSREKHIVDHDGPSGRLMWLAGMDFGIRSPTVVLWGALDSLDVLWIMDERFASDKILDDHAQAISSGQANEGGPTWPRPEYVAADPACRQTNPQTGISDAAALRKHALEVRTPVPGVQRGISYLKARFDSAAGITRLYIHKRCENLIRSLACYRYDPDTHSMEPIKDGNDHAVDALRYLVTSLDHQSQDKTASYLER